MNLALAKANITLKSSDAFSLVGAITEKASENGLIDVEPYKKQTFDIVEDGKKLGTLIQGKGWMRDVHPVCFVGWAKNSQHIDYFMETIGVGDWETADCDDVESVGFISKPEESEKRIAIIYSVDTRGQAANSYVIFGLKDNEISYDEKTTLRFQNSYIKTLSALREKYQEK